MKGVDMFFLTNLLNLWRSFEFFWQGIIISIYDKFFTGRYSYTWETPQAQSKDFDKKKQYNIITGANTGLGYELAKQMLATGESVILACRSEARGTAAALQLEKEGNSNCGDVKFIQCDLSDFNSVKAFVENMSAFLKDNNSTVKRLLCNAGVMACPFGTTSQGYEMQFGCNHLGHALLTDLLVKYFKSNPSETDRQIIIVGSAAAYYGKHTADNYTTCNKESESSYCGYHQYQTSKLAMKIYSNGLSDELSSYNKTSNSKILVNSIHPGCLSTSISRDLPYMNGIVSWLASHTLIISAEEGASFVTRLCYDPTLEGISRKFFYMTSEEVPPALCLNQTTVVDVMHKTRSAIKSFM